MVLYTYTSGVETESECINQQARTLNCRQTVHGKLNECLECMPNYYYKEGYCVAANYSFINVDYRDSVLIQAIHLAFGAFLFVFWANLC